MTNLSPLEEVLFKSWARAHGVDDHDDPKNQFDHRGLYKQTGGLIMPGHVVRQMAQTHNKAMEPHEEAGGDTVNPDPFMAQAEMHGNELKARGDREKLQHQSALEDKKHSQKLELEQMKLQHKSMESDKDRAHKAQEAQQVRAQAAQDAEMNRQADAAQSQQQLQHQAMQSDQDRQAQAEQSQQEHAHNTQSAMMNEHFERSRPQTQPSGGGPTPGPQNEPAPQATSGLKSQLMQRAMPRMPQR